MVEIHNIKNEFSDYRKSVFSSFGPVRFLELLTLALREVWGDAHLFYYNEEFSLNDIESFMGDRLLGKTEVLIGGMATCGDVLDRYGWSEELGSNVIQVKIAGMMGKTPLVGDGVGMVDNPFVAMVSDVYLYHLIFPYDFEYPEHLSFAAYTAIRRALRKECCADAGWGN